jgi:hypothetical protein
MRTALESIAAVPKRLCATQAAWSHQAEGGQLWLFEEMMRWLACQHETVAMPPGAIALICMERKLIVLSLAGTLSYSAWRIIQNRPVVVSIFGFGKREAGKSVRFMTWIMPPKTLLTPEFSRTKQLPSLPGSSGTCAQFWRCC